jgi:hypothetical protein
MTEKSGVDDAPPSYDALGAQQFAPPSQQPPMNYQPVQYNAQPAQYNAQPMAYNQYQQPMAYQQATPQQPYGIPNTDYPAPPPGSNPVIISTSQGWEALFGGRQSAMARKEIPPPGKEMTLESKTWILLLVGGILMFLGLIYGIIGFSVNLVPFMIIGPIFIFIALILCISGLNTTRIKFDPTARTVTKSVSMCPCCCPDVTMPLAGLLIDSEYIPGCQINHQPAVKVTATDPISGNDMALGGCACCDCCGCTGAMQAQEAAKIKTKIAGFLVNNQIAMARDNRVL